MDSESSIRKLAALRASPTHVVVPALEEAEANKFPADGKMAVQEENHREELEAQKTHKRFFDSLTFFLNLKVHQEALAFIIRSFGRGRVLRQILVQWGHL